MAPMLFVMGAIFYFSHQPGDKVDLSAFWGFDKVAHLVAYSILAATVILAHGRNSRQNSPKKVVLTTIIVCLLYGISDEFHQSYMPGRFVSIGDVAADVLGSILACGFWWYLRSGRRSGSNTT